MSKSHKKDGLRIHFFGELKIQIGNKLINNFPTKKSQSFFCYLVKNRHRCFSREKLIGLFWGEKIEKSARGCLNTTLWRLHKIFDQEYERRGNPLLIIKNGKISFNNKYDHFWIDTEEFERIIEKAKKEEILDNKIKLLEKAIELYQGDFLEELYDDWIILERERLGEIFIKTLIDLMEYCEEKGEYNKAIIYGQKILNYDSLRESVHRALMKLYYLSGSRAKAIRQYKICQKILEKELEISPMQETSSLYQDILQEKITLKVEIPENKNNSDTPPLEKLPQIYEELNDIVFHFQNLMEELRMYLRK